MHELTPYAFTHKHADAQNLCMHEQSYITGINFEMPVAGITGQLTREILEIMLGVDFMAECDKIAEEICRD